MQFFSMLAMIFVFAFSLLQCNKANLKSNEANLKSNETVAKDNTNALAPTPMPDEVPRISLEDAKKDFDEGKATFVDTRAEVQYKQEHIKGSINVPTEAVETRYKEIPTNKKIIAYCS